LPDGVTVFFFQLAGLNGGVWKFLQNEMFSLVLSNLTGLESLVFARTSPDKGSENEEDQGNEQSAKDRFHVITLRRGARRGKRSEDGRRRSGVRSQQSEVRRRKTGVSSRSAADETSSSLHLKQRSESGGRESGVSGRKAESGKRRLEIEDRGKMSPLWRAGAKHWWDQKKIL
jgi:hypothetical protein